eukprot:TCONS_00022544-protein
MLGVGITSAVVFLCLLLGIIVILGITNIVLGRFPRCCDPHDGCCAQQKTNDGDFSSDSSSSEDENEDLKEKRTKGTDIRITISTNTDSGVENDSECESNPCFSPSVNDEDSSQTKIEHYTSSGFYARFIQRNGTKSNEEKKKISRLQSAPENQNYGTINNALLTLHPSLQQRSMSLKSFFSSTSIMTIKDKQKEHIANVANLPDPVTIQILIVYDESSRTLSAGVRQLEMTSNNNISIYWQVSVEIHDLHNAARNLERVKSKYKTGVKPSFACNLDIEGFDLNNFERMMVRYKVFVRKRIRTAQKQFVGQVDVELKEMVDMNKYTIFEWREVKNPFVIEERLI